MSSELDGVHGSLIAAMENHFWHSWLCGMSHYVSVWICHGDIKAAHFYSARSFDSLAMGA